MDEAKNDIIREFSYRRLRFVADFPVQLYIEDESRVEQARCGDISEGGMAIRTAATLQLGTRVRLHIQFPDSSGSITLRAQVVDVRSQEYGLSFLISSTDEKEAARLLLSSLKLETFPLRRLP